MPRKTAPRLEDAPPILTADFLAFERHKWSDSEYNAERLRLKRKLQSIGEPIRAHVKKAGTDLTLRTSIHNPYTFNGNRVRSLRFYLSPSDKAKKPLRDLLGIEFKSDTDASYVHANLIFAIDFDEVRLGLSIHERAWWDTQNVKGRCRDREEAEEFAARLNAVEGGYALQLHDWQREHHCGDLKWDGIREFFSYCEPGNHRIHVTRRIPKGAPELDDPELYPRIAAEFASLLPVYDFVLWSPENNYLGMGGR